MKIEIAKKKDLKECARILRENYNDGVLSEGWTEESSNSICKFFYNLQKDLFLVARDENVGGVIGFIFGFIKPWADGNQLMAEEFCVDKRFQKQGIAKKLLKTLLEKATEKYSITQINGTTYQGEDKMPFAWYKRIGFTKVKDLFLIEASCDEALRHLE